MRLAVASSCLLTRKGLCALLAPKKNLTVALELDGALTNIEMIRKARPDVLLIDAHDPHFDLKDVTQLQQLFPDAKVVLFATDAEEDFEVQAIQAGAWGCVCRKSKPEVLEKALKVVVQGELWVGRAAATRLIGKFVRYRESEDEHADILTPREREILCLVANGCRNKEIATRLSISENTVKTHVFAIFKKIRVSTRLGATLHYYHSTKQSGTSPGILAGRESKPLGLRRKPVESPASTSR